MADIAIVGLGNLGSRHLQGLASCGLPLRICLYDPLPDSLARARERWVEVGGPESPHQLVEGQFSEYQLAIIATTADARPDAIGDLARRARVGAWLVEKPVSQSRDGSAWIQRSIAGAPAWVNLPRRLIPWHQQIAARMQALARPLRVRVWGGAWGLTCNALHFVDMVRVWTGAEATEVSVSGLDAQWHASKRPGYFEVFGTLQVWYSDGTELILESCEGDAPHLIDVTSGRVQWRISEKDGVLLKAGEVEISGRMVFQSGLTGDVAQAILCGHPIALPTLADVARVEGLLLDALIPHRAACGGPSHRLDIS